MRWALARDVGLGAHLYLYANATLEQLATHLARFVRAITVDQELVFRFYDPRVLRVYLPTCDDLELHHFFGPVQGFVAEAGTTDAPELLLFRRRRLATSPPPCELPWELRPPQLEALRQEALRGFEQRMLEHLRRFFAPRCASLGDDAVLARIREGVGRAAGHGIEREPEVGRYIDLMFMLGPDFDRDPRLPWAAQLLADRRRTPSQRLTAVDRMAGRYPATIVDMPRRSD